MVQNKLGPGLYDKVYDFLSNAVREETDDKTVINSNLIRYR